jgi:hypothetical protein
MKNDEILLIVGKYLEKNEVLEPCVIQKQILYGTNNKEVVPIEEIVEVLDFLVLAGFLEIYEGTEKNNCTYIRFLSPAIKNYLKKMGFYKRKGVE